MMTFKIFVVLLLISLNIHNKPLIKMLITTRSVSDVSPFPSQVLNAVQCAADGKPVEKITKSRAPCVIM